MAAHAKDALGGARITQVLNLPLAIATPEAARAERLVTGKDGQVLDLVSTGIAAVRATVTYKGAVTEEQQVSVRVEQRAAGITSEAVDMPSVAG